jgi:hypothetical protein
MLLESSDNSGLIFGTTVFGSHTAARLVLVPYISEDYLCPLAQKNLSPGY